MLDAANDGTAEPDLQILSSYEDIDGRSLKTELSLLPTLLCQKKCDKPYTLHGIITTLQNLGKDSRSMFPDIVKLLELIMLLPATNAVSERSFSHLRRLKNYLRNSMTQKRLNNMLIIYTYRDRYELSAKKIVNEFIDCKPDRKLRLKKL